MLFTVLFFNLWRMLCLYYRVPLSLLHYSYKCTHFSICCAISVKPCIFFFLDTDMWYDFYSAICYESANWFITLTRPAFLYANWRLPSLNTMIYIKCPEKRIKDKKYSIFYVTSPLFCHLLSSSVPSMLLFPLAFFFLPCPAPWEQSICIMHLFLQWLTNVYCLTLFL